MEWETFKNSEGSIRNWRSGIYKINFYEKNRLRPFDVYYAFFVDQFQENWGNSIDGIKAHKTLKSAKLAVEKHSEKFESTPKQLKSADRSWEKIVNKETPKN